AHEDLYDMLQVMPERDAADVFRRIRTGVSADTIVKHIQEGNLLLELAVAPETRTHFEFPYMASIPPELQGGLYFRSHVFDAIQALDGPAQASRANAI